MGRGDEGERKGDDGKRSTPCAFFFFSPVSELLAYILYILNEPFHSASLSDYDAYALPTKASHYAPMNSSNTLTIVDTTSLFSKEKSNESTQSHAMKHSNPVCLPPTNPVAFRLLSHTILPFVLYQVSYKDTLKSFRLPHDATTSFKPHLLLLSDEPTTLVTF